MKTYHLYQWTGKRFTASACGVVSFVDYGTTNPARVSCERCRATIERVAEPVKPSRAKKEPKQSIQGGLF